MKLIDKDAVLAIIEKNLSYYKDLEDREVISDCGIAGYRVVKMLKSDIESLEVKELENSNDAFIEKACSWLENNLQGIVGGSIYIEDFRKYIEGE